MIPHKSLKIIKTKSELYVLYRKKLYVRAFDGGCDKCVFRDKFITGCSEACTFGIKHNDSVYLKLADVTTVETNINF